MVLVDMAKLTKSGYARAKKALGLTGKLTKKQAQRVFKKAIKSLGRKRSTPSKKSTPKRKSSRSSGGKGGNRMGKGRNIQGTVFKWIRVGALVAPGVIAAKQALDQGWGIEGAVDQVLQKYTGYSVINQTYIPEQLVQGWGPYLMSVLTTVGIPKLAAIIRRL